MPALVGPIVGFVLGVALAWLGRAEAPREDDAHGRARARVAALFAVLVYAPVCAYFILFAGDWALFYLDDSRAVPSALWLLLVVLDAAAVVAGFRLGYQAARRRADRLLVSLAAIPAAGAAALVLAFLGQLRVDGTFHQVSARFGTRPVAGGPLGVAILWMSAMTIGGMVIAGRALGRRPRGAPPSRWGSPPAEHDPPAEPAAPGNRSPLLGRKGRARL